MTDTTTARAAASYRRFLTAQAAADPRTLLDAYAACPVHARGLYGEPETDQEYLVTSIEMDAACPADEWVLGPQWASTDPKLSAAVGVY